jgi:hypothetical protein
MAIETTPMPDSKIDANDPEQVAALLERVRNNPMRVNGGLEGVDAEEFRRTAKLVGVGPIERTILWFRRRFTLNR